MARRRYSFDLAGQNFGFELPIVTQDGEAQTESVLSDYFPELKFSFASKTQRGGRLGRAATQVTPEVTMRQREAASLGGGGPITVAPVFTNTFSPQVQTPAAAAPATQAAATQVQTQEPKLSQRESDISALYRTILNRNPDPQGLQHYASSSTSLQDIKSEMEQSPELKKKQVNALYQQVLGRDIDPSGLKTYTQDDPRAQGGFTQAELESIKQDLLGSAEYKSKSAPSAGSTSSASTSSSSSSAQPQTSSRESDIQNIYKDVLGRQADVGGLQHYAGSSMSSEDIRKDIEQSQERKTQQVNALYKEVLGREADPGGLKTYTQDDPRAQGGFTKEELESLKQTLLSSAEYKAKNP